MNAEPIWVAEDDVQARMDTLLAHLRADGPAVDDRWERVFRRTYRHVFVPRFHLPDGSDPADPHRPRWRQVDGAEPGQYQEWLDTVYQDRTLITDLTERPRPSEAGGVAQTATCSSTRPGLMLAMLSALDLHPGHRVLEIGTGTGYNAALLSGMTYPERVTTVDLAARLTEAAHRRLVLHGLAPAVVTGNGIDGMAGNAPYDRLIATTSVRRIPDAWLAQLRPGGLILANLRLNLALGALVLLRVHNGATASGRFQPGYASFMDLRAHADEGYAPAPHPAAKRGPVHEGVSSFDPRGLHTDDSWPFFASLALGRVTVTRPTATDGTPGTSISAEDGSTAVCWHTERDWPTVQRGPRRLWDALDAAHARWRLLDRPGWDRFTLTVTPDTQAITLDGHPEVHFAVPG